MKPHPQIFRTALDRMRVGAAEAAMVGDSLVHDVHGARAVGMQGVLLARGETPAVHADITVIRSLTELADRLSHA
jgi:FMN phosphatase YigB (HAD superfamily)